MKTDYGLIALDSGFPEMFSVGPCFGGEFGKNV